MLLYRVQSKKNKYMMRISACATLKQIIKLEVLIKWNVLKLFIRIEQNSVIYENLLEFSEVFFV